MVFEGKGCSHEARGGGVDHRPRDLRFRDKVHVIICVLALHVDDGLIFGSAKDKRFRTILDMINTEFNIRCWNELGSDNDVKYLGMYWRLYPGTKIQIHMKSYIEKLTKTGIKTNNDLNRQLDMEELAIYRSVLAQARWPVNRVVPELCYGISALAQKNTNQQGEVLALHAAALDELIDRIKSIDQNGGAMLNIYPLDKDDLNVLTFIDASFAQEPGLKSQSGIMNVVTSKKVTLQAVKGNLVEFESSTIQRVVRATLAAEAAALSKGTDRALYVRLLLESIIYGIPDLNDNWRNNLRIPGIIVTDAKSLYDVIMKDGSMPAERQTLIDIVVAKNMVDDKAMVLRWLPNTHQFADVLTKATQVLPNLQRFFDHGDVTLVPTEQQARDEQHRLALRQGQGQRAKERNAAANAKKCGY